MYKLNVRRRCKSNLFNVTWADSLTTLIITTVANKNKLLSS